MNKTAIEWCTHTWNPMTGCLHGCSYCYARKIAERFKGSKAWPDGFKPTFHESRLGDPWCLKKPAIIFVCSVSDLFGAWWTTEQIRQVLLVIVRNPQHRFVVLTKNPGRMWEILFEYSPSELSHVFFGTSITGENSPVEQGRIIDLGAIGKRGFKTVLSCEPLLIDPAPLFSQYPISFVNWIIVGGQTNPTRYPEDLQEILTIVDPAFKSGIPIFLKNNLHTPGTFGEHDGIMAFWTGLVPRADIKEYPSFPPEFLPIAQAWGKA